MKKRVSIFILIFILFAVSASYAHEEEQDFELNHQPYPVTPLQAVGYGSLAFTLLALVIFFFRSSMNETAKKLSYSLLVIIISAVTIYLAATTISANINSATKGPVHWHADYEIWACGKKISLPEPKGISNKQGTNLFHSHNDNRIHVEGVLMQQNQASLGAFFQATGGYLSGDEIKIPTDEGLIAKHNGDFCNSQPGRLYVFVNGNLASDPANYVIAPFEKVPPGDQIKFIFTEKPAESINSSIG
ncbi:MAG TPA: hypothetical protein VJI52_04270 [Candidatus Nanoarchaeia archaeon]|nr:hypothetical protein [Candidatus Nanoarchaeia archaeon]